VLTLALDTSTSRGCIALGVGTEVIRETFLPIRAVRSESVLPEIDRMFAAAGVQPADLSRIVVGSGPGSFTGVRISAALAKGMRAALGAELFAYSSLAAIAAGSGVTGRVCAAIDARRGQVYAAGYDVETDPADGLRLVGFSESFSPVAEPLAGTLTRLVRPGDWHFAALLPEESIAAVRAAGAVLLPPRAGQPSASALLRLADGWPDLGRVCDPAAWEPRYVRASSAERAAGE
jgi:tRNA threonylcarbamoyladenosine biosynthesis protein TsaB